MTMRYRVIFGLAALLAALDQASKQLLNAHLALNEIVRISPFFNLVNVRNYGAAFGIFNDPASAWNTPLFCASTVLACLVILHVAKQAPARDRLLFCALGSIAGGAVGNCIDRLRDRAVVDFLDFHLADLHWPAFNLADICICVGAFAVALRLLRPSGQPAEKISAR
jgi:signal peptidase II